jgi:DNA-directed RNA polymerase sigma subunit (sigma70/sigma32)
MGENPKRKHSAEERQHRGNEIVPSLTPEQEALLDERYEAHLRDPNAPRATLKDIAAKLGIDL